MQTLYDLAVGDRVVMLSSNDRHRRDPDYEPPQAVVVKVGRTRLHVVPVASLALYERSVAEGKQGTGYPLCQFMLEDGTEAGDYSFSRVRTLEQYDDDRLRVSLVDHLRAAGVTFGFGDSSLTTQQLAAILAIVRPDDEGEADPS